MLLLEIRKLNVDSMDVDETVAALAITRTTIAEYQAQQIPPPEWLVERQEQFTAEVKARRRDYLQAQLKAAKLRLERLKTPDQKRADTMSEIEQLQKQLSS